jgi:putative spermidine/putrescine transport system substrate-binding protein
MRIPVWPCTLLLILTGCSRSTQHASSLVPADLGNLRWEDLLHKARNTEVAFAMWSGDEHRNRHFRGPLAEELSRRYGITLRIVPFSDTAECVNKLLTEKSAGRTAGGSVDVVWINGENFRTAKQGAVLWGPFASFLPNFRYYPEHAQQRDFGTPTERFEAPWQRSQFVFAYDTARVQNPPRSLDALRSWVQAHPGRFTYIAPPDFTGSAFIRHVLLQYGRDFDDATYARASAKAVAWLNEIRPYLWRGGETYPSTLREQDRLFANGEIDFAMSYGPAFASVRIERGEFPPTTRTFVLDSGTLGNYNFLAVPFNAANVAGALVTINDLMSFERLLELSRVLKSPFPLSLEKLTAEQRQSIEALPRGVATLSDAELAGHFLPEPNAQYLSRFEKDWAAKVLRQ